MPQKKIDTPKVIADPLYGIFDVRPVLPMIETEAFQALGDKRQLGMSYLTFPSATHTRRAHSLGSYYATRVLADHWVHAHMVEEHEADALSAYALYHDIGHPAFSHVTEELCEVDKSEFPDMSVNSFLSLGLIRTLKKEIGACGIDHGLVLDLATHKNPLYLAVSDKNLGMEKLDYLERDGMYTILARPAGADYLRKHVYFVNGELAIDEKVVDNAIDVQNFYLKMYKNVYLRKASAIAQRMLQKIVYHMIRAGEISPSDLRRFTDSELIGAIYFSKEKIARHLYGLLKRRDLFREAIVVRPHNFIHVGAKTGKPVAVFGVNQKEMEHLLTSPDLQSKNQAGLENLEAKIAALAGLPEQSVLVVPITTPHRFQTSDVKILRENGALGSLRDRYPAHFKEMEEVAQSYLALRMCTLEQHRKVLSDPAITKEILDLLLERKTVGKKNKQLV